MEDMVTELLPPGALEGWGLLLAEVRESIGQGLFDLYFYGIRLEEIADNVAFVSTLKAKRPMLKANYQTKLTEMMSLRWPQVTKVQIVDRELGIPYRSTSLRAEDPRPKAGPEPRPAQHAVLNPALFEPKAREPEQEKPAEPEAEEPQQEPEPKAQTPRVPQKRDRIMLEDIIRACCLYYKVHRTVFVSKQRTRDVVWPRQVCFYLCKKLTHHSLPELGRKLGGRDHTTALHSIRKVEKKMVADPKIAEEVDFLFRRISYGDALPT